MLPDCCETCLLKIAQLADHSSAREKRWSTYEGVPVAVAFAIWTREGGPVARLVVLDGLRHPEEEEPNADT